MNELNIKAVGNKIVFPDTFFGIDVNNLIASIPSAYGSATYTATQDCIVCGDVVGYININSVRIYNPKGFCLPLKKGDTLSSGESNPRAIRVFGIKY